MRPTKNVRGRLLRRRQGESCDHCREVVRGDEVIWWLERATPRACIPTCTPPYAWHYGHSACLGRLRVYDDQGTGKPRSHVHKTTVVEFLNVLVPQYRQWWSDHNKYWGILWGKEEAEDGRADAFEHFAGRMSSLKNPR